MLFMLEQDNYNLECACYSFVFQESNSCFISRK